MSVTVSGKWPERFTLGGADYWLLGESRDFPPAKHYGCSVSQLAGAFAPVKVDSLGAGWFVGRWGDKHVHVKSLPSWVQYGMAVLVGRLSVCRYTGRFDFEAAGCIPLRPQAAPHRIIGRVVKVLNLDTAFARNGSGPDAYVSSKDFDKEFRGLRVGDRLSYELEPGSTHAVRIRYAQ